MADVKIKQQNLSLELTKLIAACFVVFIHVPFPGELGILMGCLGRFAVPLFFAVSGFYSLDARPGKIKKRMLHLLKLHLITALLSLGVGCLQRMDSREDLVYYLLHKPIPDAAQWIRWLTVQENPFGGHLWYLSALLLCYGVLWGCRTFWGSEEKNGPLYQLGAVLFGLFLCLSMVARVEQMEVPYMVYRNGWLMGLPMFTMGMFLAEYRSRLMENFRLTDRKMLALMALGLGLTVLQYRSGYHMEIPLGMLLFVPVLMLFLQEHPQLPVKGADKLAARFGVVSTAVYLLHIPALDLYNLFLKEGALQLLGTKEDTLMPIVVLAITLVGAFFWERIDWLLHNKKGPR